MSHSTLVLVRHGQSAWNEKNLFTGWRDPELTEKGKGEAVRAGNFLADAKYRFDVAFTSALSRAQDTLALILRQLGQESVKTLADEALNERDYGDLSGLNKDDARAKWGEEQVHIWRRSFDVAPPGGESLKMTAERVLPYFEASVRPHLAAGETVLIAAHGNSLRALIMALEDMSPEAIVKRELATGSPIIYTLAADGTPLTRTDYETGEPVTTILTEAAA